MPRGRTRWWARRERRARGRLRSPSARSSRRRWPPESVPIRASRFSSSPTRLDDVVCRERRGIRRAVENDRLAHRQVVPDAGSCGTMPIRSRRARPPVSGSRPSTDDFAAAAAPVSLEDLDGRRLAGPVRTEQREDLAALDREIDAGDGFDFIVGLAQVADDDGRLLVLACNSASRAEPGGRHPPIGRSGGPPGLRQPGSGYGRRITTRVPAPGAETTSIRPPAASTRTRWVASPMWPSASRSASCSIGKPRPLSSTASSSSPSASTRRSVISVACACRTTLATSSRAAEKTSCSCG